MKCVLCKKEIEGYGKNAAPLAKGMCCDKCNNKVVAKRISLYFGKLGKKSWDARKKKIIA